MHLTKRLYMLPRSAVRASRRASSRASDVPAPLLVQRGFRSSARCLQAAVSPVTSAHSKSSSGGKAAVLPNAALFESVRPHDDKPQYERPVQRFHQQRVLHAPEDSAWCAADRVSFRRLLEECAAKGAIPSGLRNFLEEYPILETHWNDEELVLIVGALIRANRDAEALALLKTQVKDPSDRSRLNRVAAESARLGNVTVALGILDIAKHFKMGLDVVTYTSAIHACARGPRESIPVAFQLLDEMLTDKVTPNHRTYGAIVLAYARSNREQDIEELLEEIPYDNELSRSDVYAAAITTCVRNRKCAAAVKLFATLMDEGVYLGEKVANAALSACARMADLEMMTRVMAFIETNGQPSIYTFNSLISAFGNAGRMDDALATFERLQASGISPDIVTLNALLLGARRSRREDLLPFVVDKMEELGFAWNVITLNGLLQSCEATRNVALAKEYWRQAVKVQKLRLDRTNYEALMGVYFEAGQYKAVLDAWRQDYTCRRRARSAKTLNYLMQACAKLGDVESAEKIMQEFMDRGQVPTAITHNHLLSTYLQADDLPGALKQLHFMASDPALSTVFAFTRVMKYAAEKEQWSEVVRVFEDFEDACEKHSTAWSPQLQYPQDGVLLLAARAMSKLRDHERLVELYKSLPTDTMSLAAQIKMARIVLASCETEEDWRCAVSLYDELSKHVDDDTNVEFYEIVVKIVARAGEFEQALDVNGGEWYRQNRPDQGWF